MFFTDDFQGLTRIPSYIVRVRNNKRFDRATRGETLGSFVECCTIIITLRAGTYYGARFHVPRTFMTYQLVRSCFRNVLSVLETKREIPFSRTARRGIPEANNSAMKHTRARLNYCNPSFKRFEHFPWMLLTILPLNRGRSLFGVSNV